MGLLKATELGISDFLVASDSQEVVVLLKGNGDLWSNLGNIVDDNRRLLAELCVSDVIFQPCSSNRVAHSLAQFGLREQHHSFWAGLALDWLVSLLHSGVVLCGPDPLTITHSLTQSPSTSSPLPVFSSKFRTQHSSLISSLPIARLGCFHPHFLVSPLVHALSSFDDDPIARQVVHLISGLCDSAAASLSADFVARVSDRLSSGALAWSRRHLHTVFPPFSLCLSVNSGTAVGT
ncbi:PREDICTED: PRD1 [Prunus dulcis]|uniref:PREDICTED: PRD1 n=1 Tax=Prunus dulcis TaxID=3755 RepID=A0A5E4GG64_PRUDU|nr:PREDICTED: PRD1 [Prunus dulcis]